jgi:hypothetical protein
VLREEGNKGRIGDAGSKREGVNRNIRKEEELLVLKGKELEGYMEGKGGAVPKGRGANRKIWREEEKLLIKGRS